MSWSNRLHKFGGPGAFGAATCLVALLGPGLVAQTRPQPNPAARATPSRDIAFTSEVSRVIDGDTLEVSDVVHGLLRIRLEGIDCPEGGQPFGQVARNFTRQLAFGRSVIVRVANTDRYGRLVALVTSQGKDLSLELVKAGLAWHYTEYSSDPTLAAAEREARNAHRGLWVDPSPVPPWVARRPTASANPVASNLKPATSKIKSAVVGPFHANTQSRVYHSDNCPNAHCLNCSLIFKTENEAKTAGYRPAGDCITAKK
jgi:micrococcal nuclease